MVAKTEFLLLCRRICVVCSMEIILLLYWKDFRCGMKICILLCRKICLFEKYSYCCIGRSYGDEAKYFYSCIGEFVQ